VYFFLSQYLHQLFLSFSELKCVHPSLNFAFLCLIIHSFLPFLIPPFLEKNVEIRYEPKNENGYSLNIVEKTMIFCLESETWSKIVPQELLIFPSFLKGG